MEASMACKEHLADHTIVRPSDCKLLFADLDAFSFRALVLVCAAGPIDADIANTLVSSFASIPICMPFAFDAGVLVLRLVGAIFPGALAATHRVQLVNL